MIASKVTLVAATATQVATGGDANNPARVKLKTALTDLFAGGPGVTSAAGFPVKEAIVMDFELTGGNDLWLISAAGGDVNVLVTAS